MTTCHGTAGSSADAGPTGYPVGHGLERLRDRGGIRVAAADGIVVLMERKQERAVAAVNFEDARAWTYIKDFRDMLGEILQRLFVERGDVDRCGIDGH
jgi:hypothetical protein